jgi:multidrug transporter EmrE-like cation transporter
MKKKQLRKNIRKNNRRAIILVTLCTLLTSAGQIMWKVGAGRLDGFASIFSNYPLLIGFIIYGLASGLLITALKYGDLSLVYPFVALSFVWVNILSIIFFNEFVSPLNWLGIAAIIFGVSFIGYGGQVAHDS